MNALVPIDRAAPDAEILGPGEFLPVIAALHPLSSQHSVVMVPLGLSLKEIVDYCGMEAGVPRLSGGVEVFLSGERVEPEWLPRLRPRTGAHVFVRARPKGSGFGGILKSILQFALVAVASFFFGPAGTLLSGTLGSVVGAAVIFGGSMLLNSLFPPAETKSDKSDPVYSISSRQNTAAQWGPIPDLLGKHRIAAKYAASPFTEIEGNDQYLYMLVVWGLGPMSITDIEIDGTPLADYENVTVETFEGYADDPLQTIYPSTVIQDDLQVEPEQGKPVVRDVASEAVQVAIDLLAPQGLANIGKKDGSLNQIEIVTTIRVIDRNTGRPIHDFLDSWVGKTRDPIRKTIRLDVPQGGDYFVQLTRQTPDDSGEDHIRQVVWSAIRSYRNEPAIQYRKPLALTALKIKASKQLSGAISTLTAVCHRKIRGIVNGQWTDNVESRNPADIFRHVLQGPGNARPVGDSQIDLTSLQAWHEMCVRKGWTFDMYRDFKSSVRETLRDVAAAGRATPVFRDGQWAVAMEDASAPLVQVFSVRNVSDFSRTMTYEELPHALRVKFVNETKDWIEDEKIVYDDGFDRTSPNLLYETVEFPGITKVDTIFKHARYRQAENKLRRSTYEFSTGIEYLVCGAADRVKVQHYVLNGETHSARVLSVNGQTAYLDSRIPDGMSVQAADVRRANGIVSTLPATRSLDGHLNVTGQPPAPGDLITTGPATIDQQVYRVLRIRPGSDFTARIELVDDAPGIQGADTGPIVGPDGTVVSPPPLGEYRPRNLRLEMFNEDRALGTVFIARLLWSMVPPPGFSVASYLIIAMDAEGNEVRAATDSETLSYSFENIQDGQWTFWVAAYFTNQKLSNLSDPLSVAINVPWDELGPGLGNIQPDIRYIFDEVALNWRLADELFEELAARISLSVTDLDLEANRLNSKTFSLGADVEEVGARVTEEIIERKSDTEMLAARAVRVETRLDDAETGLSGQSVAIDSLVSRTTINEQGIETAAESLRGVRSALTDLEDFEIASSFAIDTLQTNVSQQGSLLTATSTTLTQIVSRIDNPTTGLSALAGSIGETKTSVTQQGTSVNTLVTQTNGLLTRMSTAEGNISSQAGVNSTQNASISSLNGTVNAQASTLNDVRSTVGDATAQYLTRATTRAGPAGTSVRVAHQFRRSVGSVYEDAGVYYDLSAGGPPTVVFDFSRFIITDSNNSKAVPFYFQNGTIYASAIVTSNLIAGTIKANSVITESITVGGVTTDRIPQKGTGDMASVSAYNALNIGVGGGFDNNGIVIVVNFRYGAGYPAWSVLRHESQPIAGGTVPKSVIGQYTSSTGNDSPPVTNFETESMGTFVIFDRVNGFVSYRINCPGALITAVAMSFKR